MFVEKLQLKKKEIISLINSAFTPYVAQIYIKYSVARRFQNPPLGGAWFSSRTPLDTS